jgi:hypothetical protein
MGQFGRESRSFEEAVRADRKILEEEGRILGNGSYEDIYHSYIRRGIYAPQLERFLDFYGDQLLVIPSWKLFEEPRSTMMQVFRHVGCKPIQVEGKVYNEAGYDEDIPKAQKLERLFQPYNRQLYDLVGSSEWWKY